MSMWYNARRSLSISVVGTETGGSVGVKRDMKERERKEASRHERLFVRCKHSSVYLTDAAMAERTVWISESVSSSSLQRNRNLDVYVDAASSAIMLMLPLPFLPPLKAFRSSLPRCFSNTSSYLLSEKGPDLSSPALTGNTRTVCVLYTIFVP